MYSTSALELITRSELAELLDVHPKTIRQWERNHKLPFILVGRRKFYSPGSVMKWASQREAA